jgi:nicotinamide-nucleotide amidase
MNAAILTIGEEILIGQIVDTNSAWIASELNLIGISVREIVSITDSGSVIKDAINQLLNKYDIVLATGGLGPTNDDITKQAICDLFDSHLIVHSPTLEHIREIFSRRSLPLTDLNAKQAEVPANCQVLFNPNGTAPGMWFDLQGKVLVSMPGVPFEMKALMELHVLPRLKELSGSDIIVHRTIHTYGIPESFLAEKLSDWENNLPSNVSLAYLPSPISIRLRISSIGTNRILTEHIIKGEEEKLKRIIPEYIFGYEKDTMESVVAELLLATNSKLALAESCTGGTIAHLITMQAGASAYFVGGVVAYSNEIKISQLGVNPELISSFGAVSQQVVETMANGVREKFNADYSISTSGIAGPTGATPGKPVGTLWVAVSSRKKTVSKMLKFGADRERNIIRSSISALNMLRELLLEEKK